MRAMRNHGHDYWTIIFHRSMHRICPIKTHTVWFRKYPSTGSNNLRPALSIHGVKVRDEKWPLLFFPLTVV